MGCLLTAVSADGDSAEPEERSERWRAGPLALRRKNYLRRVSTLVRGAPNGWWYQAGRQRP